jgi:DNA-binding NarL/FixJ family response regulator
MNHRIVIADDHPLFRAALGQAVGRVVPQAAVIEASSVAQAAAALRVGPVELLLLDLHMEDSHGFAALLEFRQLYPAVPVIVVSASEEPGVPHRAVRLGAAAFIPKSADLSTMTAALEAVRSGDIWLPEGAREAVSDDSGASLERLASLTPAQLRVLGSLSRGLLNKQIAFEMSISEATVKAHVTAVFRKLGVINRTQAVLIAGALEVESQRLEGHR